MRVALACMVLFLTACIGATSDTTAVSVGGPAPTVASPATPSTTLEVTTTVAPAGPVEVPPLDTIGLGGGGAGVSTARLAAGTTYRFGAFALPFLVTAPIDHWASGPHGRGVALLEWRGESGQRGGTAYVLFFNPASGSADEAWAGIEAIVTRGFDKSGSSWEWIETGVGRVASIEAEWREVRTTPDIVMPSGYPCIIGLPNACVWIDATARFYVVPVGSFTVSVAVWENRCDCEVGSSYRSFVGQDNELHDLLPQIEAIMDSIAFEG